MISIYNKAIVKELNPRLFQELEDFEKQDKSHVRIVDAYNGEPTITIEIEGKTRYLLSRYNPSHEAEQLFENCEDINENSNLVFFGVGLGYHIKEANKRFPKARYYIVEPNLALLYTFLENVELKDYNIKYLEGISCDLSELDSKIPDFIFKYPKEVRLVWLKGYTESFEDVFETFRKKYLLSLKNERQRVVFFQRFQHRTVTNELKNIKEILKNKQLFAGDLSSWEGKTAIIVAAGPSLDEEIENLRKIKEKKMAYIFAAGSAVNTLINNGILPDALFSYDPSEKNQIVVKKIKEENITEIPLLFGGGIGEETLVDYTGKKFYIKNKSNEILNFFLTSERKTPFIKVGPTISIMAIDAAFQMGFSDIILVGQNLGTSENKSYSSGIEYQDSKITVPEQYSETAKNVHGEDMKTSPTYLSMQHGIEAVIEVYHGDAKVWNATRNGLDLKGAEYRPLSELMERMKEDSVVSNWQENREDVEYNQEYILEKIDKLWLDKKEGERQQARLYDIIGEIKKNVDLGLWKQLPKLYTKLHFNFKRIEENDFNALFILPAMIQEYHDLTRKIEHFNTMEDKKEQAMTIYHEFEEFANIYQSTLDSIINPYEEMVEYLEEYCERGKKNANNN